MNKKETIRFLILRSIGNFLVLFAIFGVLSTFGPAVYYEIAFRIMQLRGVSYTVVNPSESYLIGQRRIPSSAEGIINSSFANILDGPTQQILIPKDPKFDILIPKIGINVKVFPNVDPSNPNIFLPILKQGVAQAKGTVFPGMQGITYLFAHSTDNFWDVGRYNAVFYLLHVLRKGDKIVIFFDNKRYNYIVTGSKLVPPSNVSYLINSKKTKGQLLILQTCWPPGTTLERLLVMAKPQIN